MNALRPLVGTARDLLLIAVPHGGQLAARRNAWTGMSENATRTGAQREATAAMDSAVLRAQRQTSYAGERLAQ